MQKTRLTTIVFLLFGALPVIAGAQPAKPTQPPATSGAQVQPPATSGTQVQPPSGTPAQAPAGKPGETTARKPGQPPAKPVPPSPAAKGAAATTGRWTDLGLLSVSGGYQAGGTAFSETFTYDKNLEKASITTQYPKKDGSAFAASGTFRVWRNLGASVGVSSLKRSTSGEVSGTVPHPFFFQTNRPVSASVPLDRTETAVHLSAAYVVPAGRRMLVTVGAGPSFFSVSQSLVDTVDVTEEYPYDQATLRAPIATSRSKSKVGFNAGVDVGYYFTKTIGVGAGVRYAAATLSLPSHGQSVSVKAGGIQAGAGLRVRIPKPAPKPKTKTPAKPATPPKPAGKK